MENEQMELIPKDIIRTETALSRFPIHCLAKQSNISIRIRETNDEGEAKTEWKVSYNSEHGQPSQLAYKLDTIIINRRIDEIGRPVPKIIKLGSLRELCEMAGLNPEGKNTQNIKKALHQNASAYITAKINYKQIDGTERRVEAGFTRYSVIFTGEELPDGSKADGIHLLLNEIYQQIINSAITRPLDYDYLKELPPTAQRFYELLSYKMFAAVKNNLPYAEMLYSEFCTYAPQTRHGDYDRVKGIQPRYVQF